VPSSPRRRTLLILAGAAVVVAAGIIILAKTPSDEPQPCPEETFHWGDQPIAFSPPPKSWARERHQEGGRSGVRFTRYAVPPSRIVVAEASMLGERDRRRQIRALLRDLDAMTPGECDRAIALARPPADDPLTTLEAEHVRRANEYLNEAVVREFDEQRLGARRSIESALHQLETISYTIDDLFPWFQLTAEQFTNVDSVGIGVPWRRVVDDYPAFQTDYWLGERAMLHQGSEILTVVGRHAFVFGFLGPAEDLPLFELLVASARFPTEADTVATTETRP
jgi:hypothetical protein